jgi:hypothetical protein
MPDSVRKANLPVLSLRRRVVDSLATLAAAGAVLLVLLPLIAIFGYLV